MNTFSYKIFGLIIQSELEIPGLIPIQAEPADVNIKFGPTPNHLSKIISSGVLFESSKEEFLLKLPDVGNYHVRNGTHITIDSKQAATNDEIRLFLLGSVFGALLFQRGFTPLHGSAVKMQGKALIILGNSAVGKSTLSASLALSDYPLISDDLSAISIDSGKCVISPGIPFIKLWEDAKNQLFPRESFKRVRPQINKFSIPTIAFHNSSKGLEIQTIINLKSGNSTSYLAEPVFGAQKLAVLREHVFRDQYLAGKGMMDHHFVVLSRLAKQSKIFNVERPSFPLEIDALKRFVIKNIIQN